MLSNKTCWVVCLVIVLCTSCNGRVLESANNTDGAATPANETSYYLDGSKPSLAQTIEPGDRVQEGCKFVQVEVTRVQNPKKYPLTFEVHYQLEGNEKIFLGSFSLYPNDNPGKFMVATQGKLRNKGTILLSLVIPANFDRSDPLRVTVKRIKFLKE